MSNPMTNSLWVILLCFFARQSHQSHLIPLPTESEHDTVLFPCLAVSLTMSHPVTNRESVTLLYSLTTRQSHQSCLILCPTESEWHCLTSLPSSLINHFSSHDQQGVSDTALFLCQAVPSIMSHPMTNRQWVTLLCFSFQVVPLTINYVSSHDQQPVSDTALFLCQAVSSVMSHPMTNRQ